MMVRFSDWMINWQLVHQIVDGGFAREPYERCYCSAISFAGSNGSEFVFQGCFSLGGKGLHLLIGWGAPKVSADPQNSDSPVASRRHFWTGPCCWQCLPLPRYAATQPNQKCCLLATGE